LRIYREAFAGEAFGEAGATKESDVKLDAKLDAKTVAALRLDGKDDETFWDGELPGFGLRLRRNAKSGRVEGSWVAQFRRAGGTRKITLATLAVLGPEAARKAAKKELAKVALGQDPQADRQERRAKDKVKFSAIVSEYLGSKKLRDRTLYENTRYLSGRYFKPLHDMPLDKITRRDVAARLVAIAREHGPAVAAAARAKLGAFFTWAMQMGLGPESNPVAGTPKPARIEPRERVLTDQELAAFWNALPPDSEYGRMVRLLVLLGSRRQEIGGLAWPELDLDAAVWTKPGARTKNKREHKLPLPSAALDIIKSVPRMVGRDQLFGLRAAQGFSNFNRVKVALDAASGVRGARLHDLRRTLSTRLHDLDTPPHVVEEVLGHRAHRAGAAGSYNWSDYRDQVRAALDKWQRYVLMIADADLRAAHKRLVEGGDEKERKAARKAFIDAISEGDQRWELYLNMLRGDEAANVVSMPRKGA
jgi:integrase